MCEQEFVSVHPIVVGIFQSGLNWETNIAFPRATPLMAKIICVNTTFTFAHQHSFDNFFLPIQGKLGARGLPGPRGVPGLEVSLSDTNHIRSTTKAPKALKVLQCKASLC